MLKTTQRYNANSKVLLDSYSIKENDLYQYGCELEFYFKAINNLNNKSLQEVS